MPNNAWACLQADPPCGCTCHKISAGRRASRKAPRRLWTPSMDAKVVKGLRDGMTQKMIAEKLRLDPRQVADRIQELGESQRTGWRTRHEVTLALGVTWRSASRWQADGLLPLQQYGGRWWRISEEDVQAFVQRHAGRLFEPSTVRDPTMRRLAEVSALANRRSREHVS
jgi:hypothetical protein